MDKCICYLRKQCANDKLLGALSDRLRHANQNDKGGGWKAGHGLWVELVTLAVAHQTHPTLGNVDGHEVSVQVSYIVSRGGGEYLLP